jgi:hypothetical protein
MVRRIGGSGKHELWVPVVVCCDKILIVRGEKGKRNKQRGRRGETVIRLDMRIPTVSEANGCLADVA